MSNVTFHFHLQVMYCENRALRNGLETVLLTLKSFTCGSPSTVIPSIATSCSHPDAFVILSGTSAMLCNVSTCFDGQQRSLES